MRNRRFKYMAATPQEAESSQREGWTALFDPERDPREEVDVLTAFPEEAERMKAIVDAIAEGATEPEEADIPRGSRSRAVGAAAGLGYI